LRTSPDRTQIPEEPVMEENVMNRNPEEKIARQRLSAKCGP
jgi:hypothetical protein